MVTKENGVVYLQLIDSLKRELRDGVVTVVFVKESTGETREMVCSLNAKFLPPQKPVAKDKDEKPKKTPNPDVCVVYDIQRDGWRSFRYDSVVEFRTIDGVYAPREVTQEKLTFTPSEQ